MAGGVSQYAAICARVRVKYSQLLGVSGIRLLEEATDLAALSEVLKRTAYGSVIADLRDGEWTVSSLVGALRSRQAAEARSLIPVCSRPFASRRVPASPTTRSQ